MLIGLLELVRGRILGSCNLEEIISEVVMCKLLRSTSAEGFLDLRITQATIKSKFFVLFGDHFGLKISRISICPLSP